ncbi:MAG: hypothetical protein ACE5G3_12890, partial [Gammaproteobacteria bacterium]
MSINIEDTTTRKRDRTRSNGWAATCAGAVALLAVTAVLADDIELFVSTSGQAFQCEVPNVILLIDTSGSMDTLVETQEPWDPERVYDGCFRRDTFYYEPTAVIPDCESKAFFEKKKNACAAITGTEYTGEFQAWDAKKERWTRLQDMGEKDPKVECAADEGLHGEKTGDDDVYAVDGGAGPWSADEGQRISWGANASSVTVFDSNWLNWLQNPPTVRTRRLDIVKEVAKSTLKSMSNVNVAMMTFNRRDGGSMQFAMEPIESARGRMNDALDTLEPGGRTPLSESLVELGPYLRGGSIEFGVPPSGLSVAQSRQGGTLTSGVYLSPLNSAGQNTYIVLLTDGGPANDVSANDLIEALPDYGTLIGQPCDDAVDGSCLDAMAEYLLMADLRPDVPGQQNAITHTIGFGVNLDLLKNTARRGGGKYFIADNTASLTAALSDLAKAFTRSASLLTGPRIPINSFNRAERLDRVFVSVFEPAPTQHWPGNLKSYGLRRTPNGTILIE